MQNSQSVERFWPSKLLDVLIQGGLIFILAALCYKIFAPFLTLMMWALILAVTLYPLHQKMVPKFGNKQGRAATALVLIGIVVIVAPTILLASSLADSVTGLIKGMNENTLEINPPSESVAAIPVIGDKLHAIWTLAANDLPALIQKMQPKIGDLAKTALSFVAGLGGGLLAFLLSFIVSGIMMAYGQGGAESMRDILRRVFDAPRGDEFATLSTATIRAVAMGVLGVAAIQAILIGVILIIANVPFAGVLSVIALLLGVAQIPALLVTLPVVAWVWMGGQFETTPAIFYTVLLVVAGFSDNILKPLLLGRGVDAPMPVILLGALGGMVSAGILGMFAGAVLLALGYQLFMYWVARGKEEADGQQPATASAADPGTQA
jgi:predicted PurR-regulated permease PerM